MTHPQQTYFKNIVTKEAIAHHELLLHLPQYFKLYLKVSVKEIFNVFFNFVCCKCVVFAKRRVKLIVWLFMSNISVRLIDWSLTLFSTIFLSYHGSQFTYSCVSWLCHTSNTHNDLSKQLAAFPHRLFVHW